MALNTAIEDHKEAYQVACRLHALLSSDLKDIPLKEVSAYSNAIAEWASQEIAKKRLSAIPTLTEWASQEIAKKR